MPLSTALKEVEQEENAVNMSSFTGKAFVLGAPPKKKASTPVAASPATASEPTSLTPLTSILELNAFPSVSDRHGCRPQLEPPSTASEPDSPMPLTPILESQAFPLAIIRASADVFELSTPPLTFLKDIEGKGKSKEIGNSAVEARRWTGPDSPLRVGLGLSYEEVRQQTGSHSEHPSIGANMVTGVSGPLNAREHDASYNSGRKNFRDSTIAKSFLLMDG
ncbi:hypothetical protein L227DRAFT_566660 [Lentinus tigrinus ALCF2SS1-6]|uniref:Uncharacterized protein n=1 Tax=Lentinus tigrinus ALCF2SS1-6 TaxID=1328759 RepID=A0A5C2RWS7_9APHY|nr:hypothetical protein L227DRAFT_566660 [Lentinus tigrinus ALCF2SS1-6]